MTEWKNTKGSESLNNLPKFTWQKNLRLKLSLKGSLREREMGGAWAGRRGRVRRGSKGERE